MSTHVGQNYTDVLLSNSTSSSSAVYMEAEIYSLRKWHENILKKPFKQHLADIVGAVKRDMRIR